MEIDFYSIKQEYLKFEEGRPKMAAIKKAIKEAEREKNYDWQLIFMEDFIEESIFYEDGFEAFIMFPEYLYLYDKNKDNLKSYSAYNMIWTYKWIITQTNEFYQITYEKIFEYFEDFKQRCLENGYSLRAYTYEYISSMEYINIDKFKEILFDYLKYERDSISESEISELNTTIYFNLFYSSFDNAMKLIYDLIDKIENSNLNKDDKDRSYVCLYNNLLCYYTEKDDVENSKKYEKMLYKKLKKNCEDLFSIGTILEYCAKYDIDKGVKRFTKHFDLCLKCRNPYNRFDFELGAYKLFKNVKKARIRNKIKLLMPKEFSFYKEDGNYNIDDLINYFKVNLTDTAEKFDKRNRNDYFYKRIEED